MRKVFGVLLAVLLIFADTPVLAEPEAVPDPPAEGGAVLTILNTLRFGGMDQTYDEGYVPSVTDGNVQVILPLTSRVPLTDNMLTVQLQAADSAPLVLPTYDRTVAAAEHIAAAENGEQQEVSCYLIAFVLALAEDAAPGRWPLTIAASGRTQQGEAFQESFTVYVTIPEQYLPEPEDPGFSAPEPDPGAAGSIGEAVSSGGSSSASQSTPPPVPRLMLASVQTSPWPVSAGQDFTVEAVLRNADPRQDITNVLVTLVPEGSDLMPLPGQPLAFHFDRIAAGDAALLAVSLHAEGGAQPGSQKLGVRLVYEGRENQQYTGEDEILIALVQPVRLSWDVPDIPPSVEAGDTLNLAFQAMNQGRAPLYNVQITLEGPGLQAETSLFLGTLESGEAAQGEMYVFVGMLNPDDPDGKYGKTAGHIALTAENAEGEVTTLGEDFETEIKAPFIEAVRAQAESEPEEDTSFQWILTAVAAAGVIAVLLAVQITRRMTAAKMSGTSE